MSDGIYDTEQHYQDGQPTPPNQPPHNEGLFKQVPKDVDDRVNQQEFQDRFYPVNNKHYIYRFKRRYSNHSKQSFVYRPIFFESFETFNVGLNLVVNIVNINFFFELHAF